MPLNWQNEDRQQTPVCLGIPIITGYEKYIANFGGFSSLWGRTNVPRHSLRSPLTTNKKLKYFQFDFHLILSLIYTRKSDDISSKHPLSYQRAEEGIVLLQKRSLFRV